MHTKECVALVHVMYIMRNKVHLYIYIYIVMPSEYFFYPNMHICIFIKVKQEGWNENGFCDITRVLYKLIEEIYMYTYIIYNNSWFLVSRASVTSYKESI